MKKQVEQKIMSTHEHKRNEREKTGENTLIQFEFGKRRGSNFVKD